MTDKSYPAKILLFGEYTVITGGSALAIPFWKYSGHWQKNEKGKSLGTFFEHLETIEGVDLTQLSEAKKEDFTFGSSIPQGYGLGSSGSLSAAAYDLFFHKDQADEITETRKVLAEIENFFHGNSSGMDPLTCYYQKPVHIKEGTIELLDNIEIPKQLKLLDSKKTRHSKPLIDHFKIRLDADPDYEVDVAALSKFNSRIIAELIAGQDISASFREISSLQFELFIRMIPQKLRSIWQEGLSSDKYYMKLSGAGGGGFFLVYEREEGALDGLIDIG